MGLLTDELAGLLGRAGRPACGLIREDVVRAFGMPQDLIRIRIRIRGRHDLKDAPADVNSAMQPRYRACRLSPLGSC
jgi:hypothetical protein